MVMIVILIGATTTKAAIKCGTTTLLLKITPLTLSNYYQ